MVQVRATGFFPISFLLSFSNSTKCLLYLLTFTKYLFFLWAIFLPCVFGRSRAPALKQNSRVFPIRKWALDLCTRMRLGEEKFISFSPRGGRNVEPEICSLLFRLPREVWLITFHLSCTRRTDPPAFLHTPNILLFIGDGRLMSSVVPFSTDATLYLPVPEWIQSFTNTN